jgi:penicillin-binding protein 1A
VAIVWIGYDQPKSLGDRETGGGLSLPVWINFMETALKGVPIMEPTVPQGVVNVGGEWYYEEYAKGGGVTSIGGTSGDVPAGSAPAPTQPGGVPYDRSLINSDGMPPPNVPQPKSSPDERKSILDLFRN